MKNDFKALYHSDNEPVWWDEVGKPRYTKFSPQDVDDNNASQVALLLISCSVCDTMFNVAVSHNETNVIGNNLISLAEGQTISYGDPPAYDGCCKVGATISSITVKIIGLWVYVGGSFVEMHEFRNKDMR